jgi:hypothetical protein
MKPTIVLHSALTTVALADALHCSIDEESSTVFSLSGFRGSRPVLGEVNEVSFRLQKRRYWRNDFAPNFYAQVQPESGGSRIEGYFDVSRRVKLTMRLWLVLAVLIGAPLFVAAVRELTAGASGSVWIGMLVPPALILWAFVLPKLGRLLGRGEERFLLEFVQQTLAARLEEPVAYMARSGNEGYECGVRPAEALRCPAHAVLSRKHSDQSRG